MQMLLLKIGITRLHYKTQIAIFLAATFTIAGCASTREPQMVWTKPGASQQEWNQDLGQCNAQAFSVASGNLLQIAIVQSSCLQGKGWYKAAVERCRTVCGDVGCSTTCPDD